MDHSAVPLAALAHRVWKTKDFRDSPLISFQHWRKFREEQSRQLLLKQASDAGERDNPSLPRPKLLNILMTREWTVKKCHIPRDRIFAMLGLVEEGQDIVVDYTSHPYVLAYETMKVCRDVVCLCPIGWCTSDAPDGIGCQFPTYDYTIR